MGEGEAERKAYWQLGGGDKLTRAEVSFGFFHSLGLGLGLGLAGRLHRCDILSRRKWMAAGVLYQQGLGLNHRWTRKKGSANYAPSCKSRPVCDVIMCSVVVVCSYVCVWS